MVERLPIDVKTLPPDEQRAAASQWLKERQSLLVLDDVWSAESQMQLEPGPGCSVLYTSRKHALAGIASAQSTEVEKFTPAEASELFHSLPRSGFWREEVVRAITTRCWSLRQG